MRIFSNDITISGDKAEFTGYVACFYDPKDSGTEYKHYDAKTYKLTKTRIAPTAFDKVLTDPNSQVRALFNHDSNWLLGRQDNQTLKLYKDKRGIRYSIPFDENDEQHRTIMAKVQRGDLRGSSFGCNIKNKELKKDGQWNIETITEVELYEISLCVMPAFEATEYNNCNFDEIEKQLKLREETLKRITKYNR
jgi:HK97 family phage prohead protease